LAHSLSSQRLDHQPLFAARYGNRTSQPSLSTDTTYIPMASGFGYLVAAIDLANRKVIVQKILTSLEARHAVEDVN
jgi:hypothetical protein